MPELPDVEVYKRYIDSTSLSKTITEVEVLDSRVLVDTSPEELARAAKGRAFQESDRRGKHLFVKLDGDHWLALHFRMTSYPRYCKKASADDDRESRYDAVRFHLDNGYLLAFNSRRKLGRMQLIEDPEWFAQAHELGPDALSLAEDEFVEIIDRPRGRIKSTLMNQKLMSGIGNEYSDEILFQAQLHPDQPVASLDDATRRQVFKVMTSVIHAAIEAGVDPARMPDRFLIPRRHEGEPCPRCGTGLKKIKAAGRPAYICPECQPEP
ncbi:MAG: Fpg/Nei family DNA glycosylase [Oleiphilaceae bacterium]|nr:Fpg/Nei family DNA glycosylase [Oleiphilaceae bacterium]